MSFEINRRNLPFVLLGFLIMFGGSYIGDIFQIVGTGLGMFIILAGMAKVKRDESKN